MKKREFLRTFSSVVGAVLLAATVVQAQAPILLDTRGGVEVWSIPQPPPQAGFEATRIELRSVDETAKLVTFENVVIDGDIVQQGINFLGQTLVTPLVDNAPTSAWSIMPADWRTADSHINIRPDMVGGGAGGSHGGVSETNDGSDPNGISGQRSMLQGTPPISGIGPISMADPTMDAFFLDTPFQSNVVDYAYLVTSTDAAAGAGRVTMTVGVLGEGIINSGEPGGAQWGFGENPSPLVILIPEPGSLTLLGLGALFLGMLRRR